MRFKWDEAKRRSNFRKHGFDFVDVERVFASQVLTVLDNRYDYGETRFHTLGWLDGRVVAVGHTDTADVARINTFRKASENEEEIYYREVVD